MASDGWAVVAAIATAASAVVIAVQAWYTRLSVRQTAESLRLARREADRADALMREAAIARIDAEMPALSLMVTQWPYEPYDPRVVNPTPLPDGKYDNQFGPDVEWLLPRDAGVMIAVVFSVTVMNDGPRSALLRVGTPLTVAPKSYDKLLLAGNRDGYRVEVALPLEAWVRRAEPYLASGGITVETNAFEIDYVLPSDASAWEHHRVVFGGSIVEPVPGIVAGWRIAPWAEGRTGQFTAVVEPFWREYWASRLGGRRLFTIDEVANTPQ